jgi:hypothetical protein
MPASAGAGEIVVNLLSNAAAGALLGLMTAGPLKRILWNPEQGTPSESVSAG